MTTWHSLHRATIFSITRSASAMIVCSTMASAMLNATPLSATGTAEIVGVRFKRCAL